MNTSLIGRAVQSVNAPVRQLAHLLLERDGPYAQAFENLILALIVLSLVSVGLETLSGFPAWVKLVLKIGEIVIVAVFSFEYLLRIVAANHLRQLNVITHCRRNHDLAAFVIVGHHSGDVRNVPAVVFQVQATGTDDPTR